MIKYLLPMLEAVKKPISKWVGNISESLGGPVRYQSLASGIYSIASAFKDLVPKPVRKVFSKVASIFGFTNPNKKAAPTEPGLSPDLQAGLRQFFRDNANNAHKGVHTGASMKSKSMFNSLPKHGKSKKLWGKIAKPLAKRYKKFRI